MSIRKKFENLTIADDFMFCQVMSDTKIAKSFLEYLFERPIKDITLHET